MEAIKKYKVVALSVGADSNKIFKSGDIVASDAWADAGRAEQLAEAGFLEEYNGSGEIATGLDVQPAIADPQIGDHAKNENDLGIPETKPTEEMAESTKSEPAKVAAKKTSNK